MVSKIGLLLPSLAGGGAERNMLILANRFVEFGHNVTLLVADASGPLRSLVPSGVEFVDLKAGRMFRSIIPLSAYIRRFQPNVLLSTLEHANLVAIIASYIARSETRVFLREANTLTQIFGRQTGIKPRLMRALVRNLYPRAAGVIAVSEGVAADLRDLVGGPLSIRTIYNPVVTDDFHSRRQGPLPHAWLARGAPPVIISVGRLTPQKNYPLLLRACAAAFRQVAGKLIILGDGEERGRLIHLAKSLGLDSAVDFLGFVGNPLPFLSNARVFVLSSDWEGLPNALIEALACGTRVISTDCPSGPREILEGGRHGRLVPCGDVEALAAALVQALNGSLPLPEEGAADRFVAKSVARSYLDYMESRP